MTGTTNFSGTEFSDWEEDEHTDEWEEEVTKIQEGTLLAETMEVLLDLYENAEYEMGRTWISAQATEALRRARAFVQYLEEQGHVRDRNQD